MIWREIYWKAKGLLEEKQLSPAQEKNLQDIVNLYISKNKNYIVCWKSIWRWNLIYFLIACWMIQRSILMIINYFSFFSDLLNFHLKFLYNDGFSTGNEIVIFWGIIYRQEKPIEYIPGTTLKVQDNSSYVILGNHVHLFPSI